MLCPSPSACISWHPMTIGNDRSGLNPRRESRLPSTPGLLCSIRKRVALLRSIQMASTGCLAELLNDRAAEEMASSLTSFRPNLGVSSSRPPRPSPSGSDPRTSSFHSRLAKGPVAPAIRTDPSRGVGNGHVSVGPGGPRSHAGRACRLTGPASPSPRRGARPGRRRVPAARGGSRTPKSGAPRAGSVQLQPGA